MNRATKIVVAAVVVGTAVIGIRGARLGVREDSCGAGFERRGPRCCPSGVDGEAPPGACPRGPRCPPPLVPTPAGCDAPEAVVTVPKTRVVIGPSDWEAEGRVSPRTVEAGPFRIDAFETTVGRAFCPTCPLADADAFGRSDAARAASGITLAEARRHCAARGGRLPTEDEWIVAAAGDRPRRYPWGDTGAVCRRAAWGMVSGPCARGAEGPDTVGAHADGATPLGIHDLAGNVAEWVGEGVVRGGSFATSLATDLRTWTRREVPPSERQPQIGFRCAYDLGVR